MGIWRKGISELGSQVGGLRGTERERRAGGKSYRGRGESRPLPGRVSGLFQGAGASTAG